MKSILIYNDRGSWGCEGLAFELDDYFSKNNIKIDYVTADEIINENKLNDDVKAFFMPGGAASSFYEMLGDEGNKKIYDYVNEGGVYCGICAGAYYACTNTIFEQGIENLEIKAQYGLNLIEGDAIGSMYKELDITPYNHTFKTVRILGLEWNETSKELFSYYHGGPYFKLKSGVDQKILATYKTVNEKPVAIASRKVGKGKAIVSGVHFEYDLNKVKNNLYRIVDKEYKPVYNETFLKQKEQFRKSLFMKIADNIKERAY